MSNFDDIIQSNKPVLVDFYAEWCGPCKMMKPVLEELKKRVGESTRIIKIDIDKNPQLANQLGIQSVPTLVIYKNGNLLWRNAGVMQAAQLEMLLKNYL